MDELFTKQKADCETPQAHYVLRTVATTDVDSIFIVSVVKDVMRRLELPVDAVVCQHLGGINHSDTAGLNAVVVFEDIDR